MLAYGGKRVATEMRDGDIIAEILNTGICRIGKAYLTLGEESECTYLLYVGLPEFDHTEISYPKVTALTHLTATEYYGDGYVSARWSECGEHVQSPLATLVGTLCVTSSRRHTARLSYLAHDNLVRKGLAPSGGELDSGYYRRCAKSANRALNRALKRRWAASEPGEFKDVLERLLAGISLSGEEDPARKKLDKEVSAVDHAHQWLKNRAWELIPRQVRHRPSLSEYDGEEL